MYYFSSLYLKPQQGEGTVVKNRSGLRSSRKGAHREKQARYPLSITHGTHGHLLSMVFISSDVLFLTDPFAHLKQSTLILGLNMSSRGRSPSPRSITSSARGRKSNNDKMETDRDIKGDRTVSRGRDGKRDSRSRTPSRARSRSNASMRSRPRSISRSRSRSRSIPPPRVRRDSRDNHVQGKGAGWRVVIVSGLTKNVRREHLEEIFSKYGKVTGLDLPTFAKCKFSLRTRLLKLTASCDIILAGQNRGKAAIEFSNAADAEKAQDHMDQGQLDGSTLTVVLSDLPLPAPERRHEREPVRGMDIRRGPEMGYRGDRGGPDRGGPRFYEDRNPDRNGPRFGGRDRDVGYPSRGGPSGGGRYFEQNGPGGPGGRPGYGPGRDRDDPRNRYQRDTARPGFDDRQRRPYSRSRSPLPRNGSGRRNTSGRRRDSRSPSSRSRSRSFSPRPRGRARSRSASYSSYSRSRSRTRSLSPRSRSGSRRSRSRSYSRSPVRKAKSVRRSPSPRR